MLTALGAGFGATNGFVAYGGALGTPISGTLTNTTGFPAANLASGAIPSGATINNANWSGTGLAFGNIAALSANQVLGALTATTPSGLSVPSCSGASNALTWTSGTGFGCNTISGSGGNPGPYTVGTVITGSGALSNPAVNTTYCVTLTGAGTMTLPTATAGQRIVLKDCSGAMSATNTLTITPTSGNIDGQANFVMNTPYQGNGFWYNNQGSPQWSVE
jgi:hypothetical protein